MLGFLTRRIASGILLIFAALTFAFFLLSFAGANAAQQMLGQQATPAQVHAKEVELGLDQPVLQRYVDWLGHAVTGDFGTSWFSHQPVDSTLTGRFPVTLSIVLVAVLVTAVLSAVIGVAAGVRRGWLDRLVQVLSIVGFALPALWLSLVLVTTFAVNLHWFPATGYVAIGDDPGQWARGLVLPVAGLVVGTVASTAQQVRGATIDVLRQDYVRTLRARGISSRSLLYRHVLRNAAPPALTVLSLQFIGLLGGTVIIEKIFALPGIGSLTTQATLDGDVPLILGIVAVMVVLVVTVNLVIDLANGWLNPKARLA
jgi:peptide/nickel transport system permease protein